MTPMMHRLLILEHITIKNTCLHSFLTPKKWNITSLHHLADFHFFFILPFLLKEWTKPKYMMFQINTEVKHDDSGGISGLPTLFMVNLTERNSFSTKSWKLVLKSIPHFTACLILLPTFSDYENNTTRVFRLQLTIIPKSVWQYMY